MKPQKDLEPAQSATCLKKVNAGQTAQNQIVVSTLGEQQHALARPADERAVRADKSEHLRLIKSKRTRTDLARAVRLTLSRALQTNETGKTRNGTELRAKSKKQRAKCRDSGVSDF